MATIKPANQANPMNVQVGGDADVGGIAQPISSQDIDALLISDAPVEERAEALKCIRAELEARQSADMGNEIAPLLAETDRAIAQLSEAENRQGVTADSGSPRSPLHYERHRRS